MASNCFFSFFFLSSCTGEYRSRFEVQKSFFFLSLCWGEEIPPKGQFVRKWMVKKKKLTKICGYFSRVSRVAFLWSTIYLNKSNSNSKNVFCLFVVWWFSPPFGLKLLSSRTRHISFFLKKTKKNILSFLNPFVWLVTMACKGQHEWHSRKLFDWLIFFNRIFVVSPYQKISTVPSAENSSKLDEWNFI